MRKAKFITILALLLIALLVGCQQQQDLPSSTTSPDVKLVCLFFDDCWQNQYDMALPILLKYDFKATFGVITGSIGTGHDLYEYMDGSELRELAEYDMDIGCHTRTHPDLTADITDMREEIIGSKKHLEKLGFEVRTFIYPYFTWNDDVLNYVKEAGYVCARSGGHIQREPYDLKAIDPEARYHVGSTPITNQSLDEFKKIVAKASRYAVVSLCYHFISDIGPSEASTPVQNFCEQMHYLKEAGFTVVLLPDLIESSLEVII